ncbi:hypothetical protein D3C77_205930 [compost metagenome]
MADFADRHRLNELSRQQRIAFEAFVHQKTRRQRAQANGNGADDEKADDREPTQQIELLSGIA